LLRILAGVFPGLADAAVWVRGSLSAGVHREGETPKPGRGFHLYFAVDDASDIPRFGKVLFYQLWLAGYGFVAISAAGTFLIRAVIDGAVFDGERLDFVGKPVIGTGLAYTPPKAVYSDGGYLDTRALPDLSDEENKQVAALIGKAKKTREPDRLAQRAQWVERQTKTMVERDVPAERTREQLRRIAPDGCRFDLYRDFSLEFSKLGIVTVGDVLINPSRYDGEACADPFEGVEYGRTTAKFYANSKDGKPCINSQAYGGMKYFLHTTDGQAADGRQVQQSEPPPFDPDGYAQFASQYGESGSLQGKRPLCNFTATIVEEIIFDNGQEEDVLFRVEGRLFDGTPLPVTDVSAAQFNAMGWIAKAWGARPLVHAGSSIKDHLRTAIQGLVPCQTRRTVYGHIGWRKIEGEWQFLHVGGAVGVIATLADIEVQAGSGNMAHYLLDPVGSGYVCTAVRASLRLLDISTNNRPLGTVALAGIYRAPLGEAAMTDHSLYFSGQTGSRKSAVAGVALAHFGRGFTDGRAFPANWDDTDADLEAKAYAAKDALFVVDDFKPRGTSNDVQKLHAKADRLFRGAGNQSGKGRRKSDMSQRAAFFPRGLVLGTGEDIPKGASCRGRMLLVELSLTDVDNAVLSEMQRHGEAGTLERAMSAYLAWLAKRMDGLRVSLRGTLRELRDFAINAGFADSHPRAPDIYASLMAGFTLFLQFAFEIRAVTEHELAELAKRAEVDLRGLMRAQTDHINDQDEVRQFLGFLKSSLNAGLCHISDSDTQGPPFKHPFFWGWPKIPEQGSSGESLQKPNGETIGWVDDKKLYLDGNATFAAAQEMAKDTGDHLAITQRTLWKRMAERGLLLDVQREAGKLRLSPKRTIGGVSRRVYVLSRETLEAMDY